MEQLFYSNKDICERYGICSATASKRMKEIRIVYDVSQERLPKRGLLPVKMVHDFFDQSKKKKKKDA